MKIALYARISKKNSTQDTENQLQQLRAFASAQGWTVVGEYIDRASGNRAEREQFQRMFADASQRRFDAVVTWALDRLSREGVAQTFEHLKTLLAYGVQFISYTEPHFRTTGPAGELMVAIAAWIAQQERKRLSERVVAGLEKARRQGRVGGRRPLVVDRDRIAALDADGWTTREIGEEMGISAASVCRALKAYRRPDAGAML
jgi:DNA invertase Pin-like site-specific DNA recombinase